jgi:CRISPR-associated exonuclease Cas4
MLVLIALVFAILAWLLRREGVAQRGLPALKIRCADVGAIYQQPSLVSAQYGLSGRPDYLVRVDCGVVPVELKSGKSPRSGRPYDGHLFQLVAYCLLVEDVCQAFVPYGVIEYEDRSIRVEYNSALRKSLLDARTPGGDPNGKARWGVPPRSQSSRKVPILWLP